jgi:hypothetical protein
MFGIGGLRLVSGQGSGLQRPAHTKFRLKFLPGAADPVRSMTPADRESTPEAPRATPARALHICPLCASDLVCPVAWEESGPTHWDVTLHCPNCDWLERGVFPEEVVERLDEALDRGTEALLRDLQRLTRANMEDEIDRFLAALAADQIWPEDF